MCKDCGCGHVESFTVHSFGPEGQVSEKQHLVDGQHHHHSHDHHHGHAHHDHQHHDHAPHDHTHCDHSHRDEHSHSHGAHSHTLNLQHAILGENDRLAAMLRERFHQAGVVALNIVSAPGSGKTTLISETVKALGAEIPTAVIVGDLATRIDAERIAQPGVKLAQISTGTVCHLDAHMVSKALDTIGLEGIKLVIIENVGNLVCPASFDLGESKRIVLFSVPEGEEKPLKYPPLFSSADVVLLSKMDLCEPCGFDTELALRNVRKLAPRSEIFPISVRRPEGLAAWFNFLRYSHRKSVFRISPTTLF